MSEFLWGVATSAYQAEGGYNGPNEPRTNWARAEERGDVARLGRSADFWSRYAEDFARCRELGLNAFRLGIEWSRVEPQPGACDFAALDHYAAILRSCLDHGLEPVVTLHHFVHPDWLGSDPWLEHGTAERFAAFVRLAVAHVNERLPRPVRWWITINEPNMLVLNSYLGRQFPARGRIGFASMVAAYNELLRAHVLTYHAVHDLYAERGWPEPRLTFNNYCSDVYWSDQLLLDLITARERGVSRADLPAHIVERARAFDAAFRAARIPLHKDAAFYFGAMVKRFSNWIGYRTFDAKNFAPLLDTIYAAPRTRLLDYIGLDYYDPFAAHAFRFPVLWDHEFRNRSFRTWMLATVTSKWWDWRVLPRGLHFFCKHYAETFGREVLIAENGMALRRRDDGRPFRRDRINRSQFLRLHLHEITRIRRDRINRSQFLRLHLHEITRIRRDGIPLAGYLHWSLFDNYEWGTYTPRFGLYAIDFARGTEREAECPTGDRPAETYAALIREARAQESA